MNIMLHYLFFNALVSRRINVLVNFRQFAVVNSVICTLLYLETKNMLKYFGTFISSFKLGFPTEDEQ